MESTTVEIKTHETWEHSEYACPQCGSKALWRHSAQSTNGLVRYICASCRGRIEMGVVLIQNEGLSHREREVLRQLNASN